MPAFGEAYYNVFNDLKLTGGLRWTEDRKHFTDIPSELVVDGLRLSGHGRRQPAMGSAHGPRRRQLDAETRFHRSDVGLWRPIRMATRPAAQIRRARCFFQWSTVHGDITIPIHPLTFKPEFIDAFELGTKNTLLDGALTLTAMSSTTITKIIRFREIVDRTSINLNFDAHVKGAEIESTWEPLPGLRFNFAGGWEDTALAKGSQAVDLMDRTAGNPGLDGGQALRHAGIELHFAGLCRRCDIDSRRTLRRLCEPLDNSQAICAGDAYVRHLDPVTEQPYVANPTVTALDRSA